MDLCQRNGVASTNGVKNNGPEKFRIGVGIEAAIATPVAQQSPVQVNRMPLTAQANVDLAPNVACHLAIVRRDQLKNIRGIALVRSGTGAGPGRGIA